jgi:NhaP-type Na+/H+ or K+/H+ antiporter
MDEPPRGAYSGFHKRKSKQIMNESTSSPWPAIIKIALLIGCTMGFCILGLISGVLAAKLMQTSGNVRGDDLLVTVLVPPVVGALFGFCVGLISTLFVRWSPRRPSEQPALSGQSSHGPTTR